MNQISIDVANKLGHLYWSADAYLEMLERDQQMEDKLLNEELEYDFTNGSSDIEN